MLVNAYCTHRAPPSPSFPHALRSRRDTGDSELRPHLQGLMGFIMDRGKRPMTQLRYQLLGHINRVRHQFAFDVENLHFDVVGSWARETNAILFLPDGTVRAPDGAVLVDPRTGDPQQGAEVPHPADAVRRKLMTDRQLAERSIRTPASLPPVVSEVEVELRSASEVGLRCYALFACALRAEALASGKEIPVAELRERLPLAVDAMSSKERAFFGSAAPTQQEVTNHAWRYEAVALLAWSIGALGALPQATTICDVPALAKTMLNTADHPLVETGRLRPTPELLDALDQHFRLHWATTEARVKKTPPPAGIVPGVVAERHHTLNWLVRFENADWDDVTTPT